MDKLSAYKNQPINSLPRSVSKSSNMYFLEFALIVFFFFYYLLPAFNALIEFTMVLFLGIGYLAYIFIRESFWRTQIIVFLCIVFGISVLFLLLTDTASITAGVSNMGLKRIFSKAFQFFTMFFPVCLCVRIYTKASEKQKKVLFWIMVILFSFVTINTFIELMTNASASRNWEEFAQQSENNVGTYSFIYAVPMLITALTSRLFLQRGPKNILVVGIIVFLFLFLVSAQYTLALLISVVGVALQISANMKTTAGKILLWMVFAGLLFLMPTALEMLSEVVESEDMSVRLAELASFFGSGDASGYNLNGRFDLYGKSIKAFLNSPIIGNRRLSFDGHATLLTVPADIGIAGFLGLWFMIFKSKKYVSIIMKDRKRQFTPIVICLILMGLTNPIHSAAPALFAAWLIAPMVVKIGDNNG